MKLSNQTLLMKKSLRLIGLFISIILMINSCSKSGGGGSNPAPPPPAPPPGLDPCLNLSFKFASQVQPVINATCAISSNCHADGSINRGGPLTDYNKIFLKRADIKSQVATGLMPQSGSLTADQKNTIICWINSGATNN
jgi:hypothetical protein